MKNFVVLIGIMGSIIYFNATKSYIELIGLHMYAFALGYLSSWYRTYTKIFYWFTIILLISGFLGYLFLPEVKKSIAIIIAIIGLYNSLFVFYEKFNKDFID